MPEEPRAEATETEKLLNRLADTLGLPVTAFATSSGSGAPRFTLGMNDNYLLTLVKLYLEGCGTEERRCCIEALKELIGADRK